MCVIYFAVVNGVDKPIVSDGRYQVLTDGLLIVSTEKPDSGLYRCNASNVRGQISAVAVLQVIGKSFPF